MKITHRAIEANIEIRTYTYITYGVYGVSLESTATTTVNVTFLYEQTISL